jgi:hypothetical protein
LLPDHPFYKVKRWSEGVHMFFTFNDTAKARLHTHFSEVRLAEAEAMTELGKTEWVEGLIISENLMKPICACKDRKRRGDL